MGMNSDVAPPESVARIGVQLSDRVLAKHALDLGLILSI